MTALERQRRQAVKDRRYYRDLYLEFAKEAHRLGKIKKVWEHLLQWAWLGGKA